MRFSACGSPPFPAGNAPASQSTLPAAEVAGFILGAPEGSVLAVGGIDGGSLRERIDQAEGAPKDRRALFMRLRPAASVEAYVEQAIELLAETARRLGRSGFPMKASPRAEAIPSAG